MKSVHITIKQAIALGLLFGSALVAPADPVVFNVNMSVQTALGNFHPGVDTVLVAGSWDGWVTTHTLAVTANPDVYSITQNLAAASFPNYKFIINPNGNSTGNALNWEVPSSTGGGNRFFNAPGIPAGGTNVPVVYFSDAANAPAQFQVTFQVNMAVPIAQGHFVIGLDYVDAFGSWNNWSSTGGLLLTNAPGTSNYLGTLTTTNTLNSVLFYKYAIDGNGGTWEGNVGANGAQNRSLTLASYSQVLPLDYWNNIINANTNNVLFQVDMLVEYALGNFDPVGNGDTIWVNGDWDWSGSAMQLVATANPYVYTGTVALVFSPGTLVNYKYAMNQGILPNSWEMNGVGPGGGNNRQFVLPSGSATNLPLDHFNNYSDLGPVTLSALSQGKTNVLSWASGTNANNHIRLQSSPSLLGGWLDVPNTQGQSSVTNNGGPGPTFYRLIAP